MKRIYVAACLAVLFLVSLLVHSAMAAQQSWPPRMGQLYPDLQLVDQDGDIFSLSRYKGKIIIIEPIGMTCAACQAFSGAHTVGAFGGNPVQYGLPSFRELMHSYGHINLPRPDLVFIQILFYDLRNGQPKREDATLWAEHFGFEKEYNEVVAVSISDMRSLATFNMIPGFQLIDRNFILQSDSTGHNPKDDLYTILIPMAAYLVTGK